MIMLVLWEPGFRASACDTRKRVRIVCVLMMTSISEYELLRDKNIKEREALVSTEQVNSSSQVWIMKHLKGTIATS
jgi:ABC-type transporter lipoprotein component MlaA